MNEFHFSSDELFSHPELLLQNKITQLDLADEVFLSDKVKLLKFIQKLQNLKIDTYITFNIKPQILDRETVNAFSQISCCLQFKFLPEYMDKERKFFCRKMALLNEAGIVFGFEADAANFASMKSFRSFMDECLSYYPNHVYVDTENLKATDKLSTQDIKNVRRLSYSLEAFYSCGRAVPWFLAVLAPLHLKASVFLGDFSEWQECNNCGLNSSFQIDGAKHLEIEKMQLNFLKLKYEEKHLTHIFPAVNDLVRIHGAFSRCDSENEECQLEVSYHPEDILSPYAMDIENFAEEVCLEPCTVRIYPTEEGPDLEIL